MVKKCQTKQQTTNARPVRTKNGESAKKYASGKLSGGKASAYVSAEDYSVKSGEFTVKITAYDKYGNSSAKTIKASIKPAASVTLDKASLTLDKGKSSVISAKMGGGSGLTDFVSWKSSNSKIASVSNGKVTAKEVGRATITAYTTGGKNVKCTVTVKGKISDSSISAIKTQSYTGKAVSPAPAWGRYLVTVPELDSVTEREGVIISGFRTNVFLSARMESDVLVSMIGRTHVCPSSRVCSKISISLVFNCKLMIL